MTNQALQDYIFYSKYSRYDKSKGRKETYEESVDRIFDMHLKHIMENYPHVLDNEDFNKEFDFAYEACKKGLVFGSMRAFQFGGDPILKDNCKQYNCSYTFIDREKAFGELLYVLLTGCGSGLSVQQKHISKLPIVVKTSDVVENYTIADSIQGWGSAMHKLVESYYHTGNKIVFDYSQIRPKGALIAGYFKAPGPNGLRDSLDKISKVFDIARNERRQLKSIEVFSICCHLADAVLSGGVRKLRH